MQILSPFQNKWINQSANLNWTVVDKQHILELIVVDWIRQASWWPLCLPYLVKKKTVLDFLRLVGFNSNMRIRLDSLQEIHICNTFQEDVTKSPAGFLPPNANLSFKD